MATSVDNPSPAADEPATTGPVPMSTSAQESVTVTEPEQPVPPTAPAGGTAMPPGAPAGDVAIAPSSTWPRRRLRDRPARAPKRAKVVVRHVGPWSVLKLSLIFYFCVMLIVFFALLIIYALMGASGALESLEELLGRLFPSEGRGGPKPYRIDGPTVFSWLFVAGCVFTVVWSLINVFIAFIYNLISDVVGGVEVTLADKPRH